MPPGGTDGEADGNWQRKWGTQVQRHKTGKGTMCSGNYWSIRHGEYRGRCGAGDLGEKWVSRGLFNDKELGFYLVSYERH